jgi:hypothetical protein
MTDADPSPFELAEAELRKLGLSISRLPGEYRVNFRYGAESTARTFETLDHALAAGRAMAAERAAAPPGAAPRRYRRPRRMTPKAYNKRLRMAQMRRLRARAPKQPAAKPSDD